MTSRVLIAWEIGAGFGHLAAMLPLIRRLREHGVEPLYAVPDPEAARRGLGGEAPRLVAIPRRPDFSNAGRTPFSYADIVLDAGFRDRRQLAQVVEQWLALIRAEKIDTLVLDFAPFAQLAGWIAGLRMVSAGVPFTLPPVPIPAFPMARRLGKSTQPAQDELLACVNEVAHARGRAAIDELSPWLHAPRRFTVGIPQLNAYDFPPDGGYFGPIGDLSGRAPINWPRSERPRLMCYLKWSAQMPAFIKSMDDPGREMVCVIPQAPDDWVRSLPTARIRVFNTPVELAPAIASADVVVSNASTVVASLAVLAGRPQLLLPLDQEKLMHAEKLVRAGAGLSLELNHPAAQATHHVKQLLELSQYTRGASQLRDSAAPVDENATLGAFVAATMGADRAANEKGRG